MNIRWIGMNSKCKFPSSDAYNATSESKHSVYPQRWVYRGILKQQIIGKHKKVPDGVVNDPSRWVIFKIRTVDDIDSPKQIVQQLRFFKLFFPDGTKNIAKQSHQDYSNKRIEKCFEKPIGIHSRLQQSGQGN